jgi:predicted NACHT family NTPase
MSYNKVRSIKIDKENHNVTFETKCNNDTEPFKKAECTITEFFINSLLGSFQFNHKQINLIDKNFVEFLKSIGLNSSDVINDIYYDKIDEMTTEIRSMFYGSLDKIANL